MGRLVYNDSGSKNPGDGARYELEDDLLWALRAVVANKLQRAESFMLTLPMVKGNGYQSIWIAPAVPLTFHTAAIHLPALPKQLANKLMMGANSTDGLDLRPFIRRG